MNINFPKFLTFTFNVGTKITAKEETVDAWAESGVTINTRSEEKLDGIKKEYFNANNYPRKVKKWVKYYCERDYSFFKGLDNYTNTMFDLPAREPIKKPRFIRKAF